MRTLGVHLRHVEAGGAVQVLHHQVPGCRFPQPLLFFGGHILPGQAAGQIRPGLDLHEAQHAVLPGDQVDLPEPAVKPVGQQGVAPAAQIVGHLRLAPGALGPAHDCRSFHFFRNDCRCSGQGPYWSSMA